MRNPIGRLEKKWKNRKIAGRILRYAFPVLCSRKMQNSIGRFLRKRGGRTARLQGESRATGFPVHCSRTTQSRAAGRHPRKSCESFARHLPRVTHFSISPIGMFALDHEWV